MRRLLALLALLLLAVPAIPQNTRWTAPVSFTVIQENEDGTSHPFGGSIVFSDITTPNVAKRIGVFPLDKNGSTGVQNVTLQTTDTYRIDLLNNANPPVMRQSKKIYGLFLMPVDHAYFIVKVDWTLSTAKDTLNFHGVLQVMPDVLFVFPPASFY